jgi:hypothetical protein
MRIEQARALADGIQNPDLFSSRSLEFLEYWRLLLLHLLQSMRSYLAFLSYESSQASIVVDAAPSHAVNSFSPFRAQGGAIDRLRGGSPREENDKHTERLLINPLCCAKIRSTVRATLSDGRPLESLRLL